MIRVVQRIPMILVIALRQVSDSQAEDATLGANFKRPQDYNDPDLPAALLTAQRYFEQLKQPFLQ